MSRFLPLLVFLVWMSSPAEPAAGGMSRGNGLFLFFAIYVLLIMGMALISRRVARRVHLGKLQKRLRRFHAGMLAARLFCPIWFGVGTFCLGWKAFVQAGFSHTPLGRLPIESPELLVGCLPAFLATVGLWWAEYPAELAIREQNLLIQINESMPVHAPPGFWAHIVVNLRMQILFAIAPVLLLMMLHDAMALALPPILSHIPGVRDNQEEVTSYLSVLAIPVVILIGPEVLRRVFPTEPMPDCPLRRRLEEICREHGVKYRDVLLWKTHYQVGNAAVMGVVPRFRYILLSDLLLETMSDEQIEAVFAHEVGHVVHWHLWWLMATIFTMILGLYGLTVSTQSWFDAMTQRYAISDAGQTAVGIAVGAGAFFLIFGYVSRKFERQADVFAARTLQDRTAEAVPALTMETGPRRVLMYRPEAFVGPEGAEVFCSALQRTAAVNNIPVEARSWCHGSIAKRMDFLSELGRDPAATARFDHFMRRMCLVLIGSLGVVAAWAAIASL